MNEGGGKWIKPSGFNDKGVLCPFCARCMPAVSTNLNIHIATDCALDHPARAEAALAVVGSKTALKRLGKDKQDLLNKIKEEYTSTAASLSTFNQSLGGSAPANPPSGASPGLNLGANAGAGSGKRPYNDLPRLTTIGSSARSPRWTSGSSFQCMQSSGTEKLTCASTAPCTACLEDVNGTSCSIRAANRDAMPSLMWRMIPVTSDDGDADADADDPIDRLNIHDLLSESS